jgi:hypothetical protein
LTIFLTILVILGWAFAGLCVAENRHLEYLNKELGRAAALYYKRWRDKIPYDQFPYPKGYNANDFED